MSRGTVHLPTGLVRTTLRYKHRKPSQAPLRMRLRELAIPTKTRGARSAPVPDEPR